MEDAETDIPNDARASSVQSADGDWSTLWPALFKSDRWRTGVGDGKQSSPGPDFLVDAWLPSQGTSVWFGAGSTGKTQLMLWMAASIANRQPGERTWMTHAVKRTGHVLVLTAEDSEQHVHGRIRDIVGTTLGQTGDAAADTCSRLHVMAFLSMGEDEYRHPNASLFDNADRLWGPTEVLSGVRRYVEGWNARADPDDRILGVVMDSATSMCGFDTMDGHATTNFFFYLGRLCETLGIFWAIIGHVPKSAAIQKRDTRAGAANRLRGVTMWTTAPRLVVEVRAIQEWRDDRKTKREHPALRDALPEVRREDLLVVYAAKTNLLGVHPDERYLRRVANGAFEDVTDLAPHPALEPVSVPPAGSGEAPTTKPAAKKPAKRDHSAGTEAVVKLIDIAYPNLKIGGQVASSRLWSVLKALPAEDRPADCELVLSAQGGGDTPARPGAVNWHLDRLIERGMLDKPGDRYRLRAWPPG